MILTVKRLWRVFELKTRTFETLPVILLTTALAMIFVLRTWMFGSMQAPRLFDIFDLLVFAGSLYVFLKYGSTLRKQDWLIGFLSAVVIGAGLLHATYFSPYPFWGIVRTHIGMAFVRTLITMVAALGGTAIMRLGGPVRLHISMGEWAAAGRGILSGLGLGLPFAILNVIALQMTAGKTIDWQPPAGALLDALQPAIFEEIVYRFAFWGLLWLILRRAAPQRAEWLSGLLVVFVHSYAHFNELFVEAPLVALGMGAGLSVLWGLPLFYLARRRGLESAIAFHWIQDVLRFLTGF